MRELKFRAWDKFNGEYWNSSHSKNLATFFNLIQDLKDGENEIIIEQYTGLKDKNGKEIYEGDICKFNSGIALRKKYIYKIDYLAYQFCGFVLNCMNDKRIKIENLYSHSKIEIIGNIHQNPELL